MYTVLVVLQVIACLLLIGVVLLQQGKGADMGAVFGGSSATIFGSSGAGNFLTRLTAVLAVLFMLTSLGLTYKGARRLQSTVFDAAPLPEPPPLEAPANPAAAPANPNAPAPAAAPAAGAAPAPEAAAPAAEAPAAEAPAAQPAHPQANAPEAAAPAEQPAANN